MMDSTYFSCSACERRFLEPRLLREHYRLHHPEQRPFACELCPDAFGSGKELLAHRQAHARPDAGSSSTKLTSCSSVTSTSISVNVNSTRSSDQKLNAIPGSSVMPFKCTACFQTFPARDTLMAHLHGHLAQMMTRDGGRAGAAQKTADDDSSSPRKVFKCTHCPATLRSGQSLRRHLMIHTGEKPLSCQLCGKRFRRRHTLNVHLRAHTGEQPYACEQCGKRFRADSHLRRHLVTHTRARPYVCQHCPKGFATSWDLKRHMQGHADVRMYACRECPKSFRQKSGLDYHLRTHTGERPYECRLCPLTFRDKGHWRQHFRRHLDRKPQACSSCQSSCCGGRNALVDHIRARFALILLKEEEEQSVFAVRPCQGV